MVGMVIVQFWDSQRVYGNLMNYREKRLLSLPTILSSSNDHLPDWLTAGGLTLSDYVTVYDALLAGSLEDSYKNIVNPGTNDAIVSTPPTWNSISGWSLNGVDQYVSVPPILTTHSFGIQYTNYESGHLLGSFQDTNKASSIEISGLNMRVYHINNRCDNSPVFSSGLFIVSGRTCYRNGIADENTIPVQEGGIDPDVPAFIGCVNFPAGGGPFDFGACNVQRYFQWNRELTALEVAAFVTAINP